MPVGGKKITVEMQQDMVNWKHIGGMNYEDIVEAIADKYDVKIAKGTVTYHTETKRKKLEPEWGKEIHIPLDVKEKEDTTGDNKDSKTTAGGSSFYKSIADRGSILKDYMGSKKINQVMRLTEKMGGAPQDFQYVLDTLDVPLHKQKNMILDVYGKEVFAKIFPSTELPQGTKSADDDINNSLNDLKKIKAQQIESKKTQLVEREIDRQLSEPNNEKRGKDPIDQMIRLETLDRITNRSKGKDSNELKDVAAFYKSFSGDSKVKEFAQIMALLKTNQPTEDQGAKAFIEYMKMNLQNEKDTRQSQETALTQIRADQMRLQEQVLLKQVEEAQRRSMTQSDWTNHIANTVQTARDLGFIKDEGQNPDTRITLVKEASNMAATLGQQFSSALDGFLNRVEKTMNNQQIQGNPHQQNYPNQTPDNYTAMRTDRERIDAYSDIEEGLDKANQISTIYNRIKRST